MRRLGPVPLVAGIALIATFCVVIPPVVAGSDYAAVNGIGFIAGPIGAVLVLAGAVMLLSRGGPPFE